MKKFTYILVSIFTLAMATICVACGDRTVDDHNSGTNNTDYTVTVEQSDYYDIGEHTTRATAGNAAYVVVESKTPSASIDKVFFNANECALSSTEENTYTFTMPAENVEITVSLKWNDNKTDNFLTWDEINHTTIEISAETSDNYYPQSNECELTANVSKAPSLSGGFFSQHKEKVFSLNQNVIPDEALSVTVTNAPMSNNAIAFVVHIDCSKIKEGTTQLVLHVENEHKSRDASVLVCTVTVVAIPIE